MATYREVVTLLRENWTSDTCTPTLSYWVRSGRVKVGRERSSTQWSATFLSQIRKAVIQLPSSLEKNYSSLNCSSSWRFSSALTAKCFFRGPSRLMSQSGLLLSKPDLTPRSRKPSSPASAAVPATRCPDVASRSLLTCIHERCLCENHTGCANALSFPQAAGNFWTEGNELQHARTMTWLPFFWYIVKCHYEFRQRSLFVSCLFLISWLSVLF